jgi:murein DD-endopeptidase MepM/ murein hydrolase activator NlpD
LLGQERPKCPPQIWFVVAMLLLLAALVASIALGYAPAAQQTPESNAAATLAAGGSPLVPHSEPTATFTTVPTLGPGVTRRPATPAPTPMPDPRYVATTRLAGRPQEDHYWLAGPIAPEHTDVIAPSYPYGSRGDGTYPIHQGVEFVNPIGTDVLATAPGTVVVAGDDRTAVYGARTDFYGLLVIVKLDQLYLGKPVYVLCGHLSEIRVEAGQPVKAGDVLGLVGMTGIAEGPHLHLEVRYGDILPENTVNPELWLQPRAGRGTLAGLVVSVDDLVVPDVAVQLYRADQPDVLVREVVTYPSRAVNPDPSWGESFAAGDLAAGKWLAKVYRNRAWKTEEFTIVPGATTWLRILVSK